MVHRCNDCISVENREEIFTGWGNKVKVGRRPKLLGNFSLPGWTGHLPFYAFRCPDCGKIGVDYPNGYKGFLYCQYCRKN